MKLIAQVTVVGGDGQEVAPGAAFDIEDDAEAEGLVQRGLARLPEPEVKPAKAPKADKAKASEAD